jgi:hypothetical protein
MNTQAQRQFSKKPETWKREEMKEWRNGHASVQNDFQTEKPPITQVNILVEGRVASKLARRLS